MGRKKKTIQLYEYDEAVAIYKAGRKQEFLDTLNDLFAAVCTVGFPVLLIVAWIIFGY